MSIDNTIYALSNINALLGSTLNYIDNRQNGMSQSAAISDLGYNIAYGGLRNMASRDIFQNSGSYLGYMVNSNAGYGNPVSNYQGAMGTIGAMMLTTPWNVFGCCNPYMTSSIYGCGPYGIGYFNGGFFNRGCYSTFGAPSMFGSCGFWC